MSTEEPAWKAELKNTATSSLGCYTVAEVLKAIEPHIQAAEERGRREAAALTAAQQQVIDRMAREALELLKQISAVRTALDGWDGTSVTGTRFARAVRRAVYPESS